MAYINGKLLEYIFFLIIYEPKLKTGNGVTVDAPQLQHDQLCLSERKRGATIKRWIINLQRFEERPGRQVIKTDSVNSLLINCGANSAEGPVRHRPASAPRGTSIRGVYLLGPAGVISISNRYF